MEITPISKEPKNKVLFLLILPLLSLILFETVIATPVQLIMSCNIDFQGGILQTAFDLLLTVLNFSFYWIGFSGVVFAQKGIGANLAIYCTAVLFRYPLNLLSSLITVPPDENYSFTIDSLPTLGFEIFMDFLQLAIIFLPLLIISKGKPIQRSKWIPAVAGLPVLLKIVMTIYYDIQLGVDRPSDLVWMVLYYGFYLVCFYIGIVFLKKWKKLWENEAKSDGKDA